MNWRDLFYFSKGERRAFTLLLSLVSISWILLYRTDPKAMPIHSETDAYQKEKPQVSVIEPVTIRKTTSTKQTKRRYTKTFQSNKYPKGTVVELNTADTPEKDTRHRQYLCPANHQIQGAVGRLPFSRAVSGSIWHRYRPI